MNGKVKIGLMGLGTVGTVRASFYFYNNMEDVDKFIKSVIEAKNFFSMF